MGNHWFLQIFNYLVVRCGRKGKEFVDMISDKCFHIRVHSLLSGLLDKPAANLLHFFSEFAIDATVFLGDSAFVG